MSDLLSDREVAAELHISFWEVQKRCRTGQWPPKTCCSAKLVKAQVVLAFTAGDLNTRRPELWDNGQAPPYHGGVHPG